MAVWFARTMEYFSKVVRTVRAGTSAPAVYVMKGNADAQALVAIKSKCLYINLI
jgi:hypothetical protein